MQKTKFIIRRLLHKILGKKLLFFLPKHGNETFYGHKVLTIRNSVIGMYLYLFGTFERVEMDFCKQFLKPNSNIIDVGANIGLFSIFFSEIATNGKVFAFEASKYTYELLLTNTKKSNNIFTFLKALSNNNGFATFYNNSDNAYSGLKDTKRSPVESKYTVITKKADDCLSHLNLENIDFIKIDVEGFEQEVLEGMVKIIQKYRPTIMCEIYKGTNQNLSPEHTIKFIVEKGYKAMVLKNGHLMDFDQHDDHYINYFFIPI